MVDEVRRLDGWKTIAAYLGRDERTAQRWRHRGLPVHAVPGGKRGTVFAYAHELDQWLVTEQDRIDAPAERSAEAPVREAAAPRAAAVTTDDEIGLGTGFDGSATSTHSSKLRRPLLAASLVVAALAVGGLGTRWRAFLPAASSLDHAEVTRGGLMAWTADGSLAFSIPLTDLLPPELRDSTASVVVESGNKQPIVADLDGDGVVELVIGLLTRDGDRLAASEEIRCYSSSGQLIWAFRPGGLHTFGGKQFDGPWLATDWVVVPDDNGRSRIWLALNHDVWWPSYVMSLEATGTERLHLVNAGHLYKLLYHPSAGGNLVLATGVNNEYKAAVLVGIDLRAPTSNSPQSDKAYGCDSCSGASPAHYLLLPQSEVGRLTRPYNLGARLGRSNGAVRVSTQESTDPAVYRHYEFDSTLEPRSAYLSDGYWTAHARFEREGRLDHTAEQCPDHQAPAIQTWTEAGWNPGPPIR